MRRSRPWILVALVLLAAASPYLRSLPRFGSGQADDYFPTLGVVADADGWSPRLSDWLLVRSNEHRVVVPVLLYRLDVALADGDNRALAAWSLLMLVAAALALISLLPRELRDRPVPWLAVTATLAAFCLTPLAAFNVALGFSGTMWLTADALALAALALAARCDDGAPRWRFAAASILAILASWTYSSGLMVWPALLVLLVATRRGWRQVAAIAGLGGATLVLAALGYGRPSHHPEPVLGGALADYVQVFLGGLFAAEPDTARLWGRIGLAVGLAAFVLLPRLPPRGEQRSMLWPWLAVAVYALSNVLVIGIGRAAFGLQQALSLRYVSLAVLWWLACLVPILLRLCRWARCLSRPASVLVAAVTAYAVVALWSGGAGRGLELLDRFEDRAALHPAAHLALAHAVPDRRLYELALTAAPHQLWQVRDTLRAIGHIPFDRTWTWPTGTLERRAELDPGEGVLDGVAGVPGGWLRLQGWIPEPRRPVAEVVVADDAGRILGPAVYGMPRPELAERLGEPLRFCGWMGFARLADVGPGSLPFAWVRFEGDEIYHRLVVQRSVRREWPGALADAAAQSVLGP